MKNNILNQEIKFYDFVEGDYNDVYSRKYLKGTEQQIEKYIMQQFKDKDYHETQIEDLGSDSIGFGVYFSYDNHPDEIDLEYYVEARELFDITQQEIKDFENYDNSKFFYHPLIDLTE